MLHVHLLAAPDFLGFDSAIEMASHGLKAEVERGLRIKRLGNDLMASIGGREIHPVSPMVGGFSKAPRPRDLRRVRAAVRGRGPGYPGRRGLGRTLHVPVVHRAPPSSCRGQPWRVPDERGRTSTSTAGRAGRGRAYEERHRGVPRRALERAAFGVHRRRTVLRRAARPDNLNEATLTPVAREAARAARPPACHGGPVPVDGGPRRGDRARARGVPLAHPLLQPPDPPRSPVIRGPDGRRG